MITAKGVTSDPVPEVVGMATRIAFLPIFGKLEMRLRMSMKRMARSSNFTSGCSYSSHMILAASMGEPPPRATITSGLKAGHSSRPLAPRDGRVGLDLGEDLALPCRGP